MADNAFVPQNPQRYSVVVDNPETPVNATASQEGFWSDGLTTQHVKASRTFVIATGMPATMAADLMGDASLLANPA